MSRDARSTDRKIFISTFQLAGKIGKAKCGWTGAFSLAIELNLRASAENYFYQVHADGTKQIGEKFINYWDIRWCCRWNMISLLSLGEKRGSKERENGSYWLFALSLARLLHFAVAFTHSHAHHQTLFFLLLLRTEKFISWEMEW